MERMVMSRRTWSERVEGERKGERLRRRKRGKEFEDEEAERRGKRW